MKYDYTTYYRSFLTESHLLNTQKYIHWFELYIDEPNKKEYKQFSKIGNSFFSWKKYIDLITPHRYSSIVYDKKNKKRKLKYIFDECSSIYILLKRIEKEFQTIFPNIYWFKVQQYY